ncbi:MAG: cyclic nucleotide-binding domain-containing protein, partial [Cyanobacteriota bacterium]|nr:cyclic nucleotide-binding domain-containing protein [Cyanobacteriota bacterium]
MNQNTQIRSVFHEQHKLDFLTLALEKQLEIDRYSKKILFHLSQDLEILEFELGDSIDNIISTSANLVQQKKSSTSHNNEERQTQFVYIVCQGKVRLLSFDAETQQEVPIGLLTEGETFGSENLFESEYLSYKAIAAKSKVQVARIPVVKLQSELAKLAQLQEHWLVEIRNRQNLIFFKTLTALRSLSSHRIEQILPYLEKRQILAGTNLAEANLHRFWIRHGQRRDLPVEIGSFWGYPAPILDN